MSDPGDCTPTCDLPIKDPINTDTDTVLMNDGEGSPCTTVQVPVSALFGGVAPQQEVFEVSGEFEIGDYPGATAVRVTCISGSAGGAGCQAAPSGNASAGGGGQGGHTSVSLLDASVLNPTEVVVVGAGGIGGAPGDNDGQSGGASSFGAHVVATGTVGGQGGVAVSTAGSTIRFGGQGNNNGVGQILIDGSSGGNGLSGMSGLFNVGGKGGDSTMGGGRRASATSTGGNGVIGGRFGGGGSGGHDRSNTARSGGDGRSGIVIVEVFF